MHTVKWSYIVPEHMHDVTFAKLNAYQCQTYQTHELKGLWKERNLQYTIWLMKYSEHSAEERVSERRSEPVIISDKEIIFCLSIRNITQKVMNGLQWNFMEGYFSGDLDHDSALVEVCTLNAWNMMWIFGGKRVLLEGWLSKLQIQAVWR